MSNRPFRIFPLGFSAQVTHTIQLCGRRFPTSPALVFPVFVWVQPLDSPPTPPHLHLAHESAAPAQRLNPCTSPYPSLWALLLPGCFQWPPRTPSSHSRSLLATCLLDPLRSRSWAFHTYTHSIHTNTHTHVQCTHASHSCLIRCVRHWDHFP